MNEIGPIFLIFHTKCIFCVKQWFYHWHITSCTETWRYNFPIIFTKQMRCLLTESFISFNIIMKKVWNFKNIQLHKIIKWLNKTPNYRIIFLGDVAQSLQSWQMQRRECCHELLLLVDSCVESCFLSSSNVYFALFTHGIAAAWSKAHWGSRLTCCWLQWELDQGLFSQFQFYGFPSPAEHFTMAEAPWLSVSASSHCDLHWMLLSPCFPFSFIKFK